MEMISVKPPRYVIEVLSENTFEILEEQNGPDGSTFKKVKIDDFDPITKYGLTSTQAKEMLEYIILKKEVILIGRGNEEDGFYDGDCLICDVECLNENITISFDDYHQHLLENDGLPE